MYTEIFDDVLWGIHKEQLIKDCLVADFPGTNKWDKDNPIWDCNVYNKPTPKEGWKSPDIIRKAVDNLYLMVVKSAFGSKKYPEFVSRIYNAFYLAYEKGDFTRLLREVLARFTISKIAPKVTALQPSVFKSILEQSKIDIICGVYCPMAGFGGIIKGVQNYYKSIGLENVGFNNEVDLIEAYDINQNFCNYYGWKHRDILESKVSTDKIVVACPPFGKKTERWFGTPEEMYYDFHTWCKIIKDRIKAPNYILIGPEISDKKNRYKSGAKVSGLFIKKIGVSWYKEYSN